MGEESAVLLDADNCGTRGFVKYIQEHLSKLEYCGKVQFSNATQIVKLVYYINSIHTD